MRRMIFMLCAVTMLTACQKIDLGEEEVNGGAEVAQTKRMTFNVQNDVKVTSRATSSLTDESMTDLWVCVDSVLTKHQVSTDTGFGSVTLDITYGKHTISFVASSSVVESTTGDVVSLTTVRPTFGNKSNYVISDSYSDTRNVTLTRQTAQIKTTFNDVFPENVSKITFQTDEYYSAYNVASLMVSGESASKTISISVPSSWAGKTGKSASFSMLTADADSHDRDITITAYDADEGVVLQRTITAPVQRDYLTTITGTFFSQGSGFQVSIQTEYTGSHKVGM